MVRPKSTAIKNAWAAVFCYHATDATVGGRCRWSIAGHRCHWQLINGLWQFTCQHLSMGHRCGWKLDSAFNHWPQVPLLDIIGHRCCWYIINCRTQVPLEYHYLSDTGGVGIFPITNTSLRAIGAVWRQILHSITGHRCHWNIVGRRCRWILLIVGHRCRWNITGAVWRQILRSIIGHRCHQNIVGRRCRWMAEKYLVSAKTYLLDIGAKVYWTQVPWKREMMLLQ